MDTRKEYLEIMEAKMEQLRAKIKELSAKMKESNAETRIKLKRQLDSLEGKRDEFNSMLEAVKSKGESEWNKLKGKMQAAYEDIKESLEA